MEAVAKVTHVRIAPRKVRVVIDLIRNKTVGEAIGILKNTPKAASPVVEKLLVIANADILSNILNPIPILTTLFNICIPPKRNNII